MKNRWLFTLALGATLTAVSLADTPEKPPVTSLRLIPAAEPVPSLKYRLLPELRDQTPGNAIMGYYRAYSPEWQGHRREKNWAEPFEKAAEMPLAELRGSEVAKSLAWVRTSSLLREVDRAARRSYCDWELTERLREDGIALMLPDLQGMREFAKLLAVRARLEMADGKFDDAARTLQTGYALARHTGDGLTLIHGLVGIAIASVMNKQVETWVQTPGSPNLYWALTDLPVSFIDLRKGFQGERLWFESILPHLRESLNDPTRPPFSQEQMRQAMEKFMAVIEQSPGEAQALGMLIATAKYAGAKKFLAERGWTAAQIDAVPVLQAVFMQEIFEYDRFFDLLTRGTNLPYPQGRRIAQDGENQLRKMAAGPPLGIPIAAKMMLPAIQKVTLARVRLDRQIAALRVVEAIRLYASANGGKLPESLESIVAVPIPLDPITGQPFQYGVTGDKATLSAPSPLNDVPSYAIRYEITIGN
jgi:hypothetical protein